MGQLRPHHRQFESHLLDHRRPARRAPRPDHAPGRRPALHYDRVQPRQAHDRGRAGRCGAGLQAAVAGQVQHRPSGDQSALCRDLAAGECRHPGASAHRHGGSRRQRRAAASLRDHRAHPRRAVADVHGREVRPRPDLGRASRDRDRSGRNCGRCRALRSEVAVEAADAARGRRHAAARDAAGRAGHRSLRRRDTDRRPHGPGRRPGRGARRQAAAQAENHARHVRRDGRDLHNRMEGS